MGHGDSPKRKLSGIAPSGNSSITLPGRIFALMRFLRSAHLSTIGIAIDKVLYFSAALSCVKLLCGPFSCKLPFSGSGLPYKSPRSVANWHSTIYISISRWPKTLMLQALSQYQSHIHIQSSTLPEPQSWLMGDWLRMRREQ